MNEFEQTVAAIVEGTENRSLRSGHNIRASKCFSCAHSAQLRSSLPSETQ